MSEDEPPRSDDRHAGEIEPTAELINLRRARKAKARVVAEENAKANRAKHGLTKEARDLAKARLDAAANHLERHKRDER